MGKTVLMYIIYVHKATVGSVRDLPSGYHTIADVTLL